MAHAQTGERDLLVDSQFFSGLQVFDKDARDDMWVVVRQRLDHLAQHLHLQRGGLAGFDDQFSLPVGG